MKSLVLISMVLLAGCAPAPRIVYRIPEDKKEAASKMMIELMKASPQVDPSVSGASAVGYVMDKAWDKVEHIYGEPVVIKP